MCKSLCVDTLLIICWKKHKVVQVRHFGQYGEANGMKDKKTDDLRSPFQLNSL